MMLRFPENAGCSRINFMAVQTDSAASASPKSASMW